MELARTALSGEDLGPAKDTRPFHVGVLVACPIPLFPMAHLSNSFSQADRARATPSILYL